jgi:hypothetical protein
VGRCAGGGPTGVANGLAARRGFAWLSAATSGFASQPPRAGSGRSLDESAPTRSGPDDREGHQEGRRQHPRQGQPEHRDSPERTRTAQLLQPSHLSALLPEHLHRHLNQRRRPTCRAAACGATAIIQINVMSKRAKFEVGPALQARMWGLPPGAKQKRPRRVLGEGRPTRAVFRRRTGTNFGVGVRTKPGRGRRPGHRRARTTLWATPCGANTGRGRGRSRGRRGWAKQGRANQRQAGDCLGCGSGCDLSKSTRRTNDGTIRDVYHKRCDNNELCSLARKRHRREGAHGTS